MIYRLLHRYMDLFYINRRSIHLHYILDYTCKASDYMSCSLYVETSTYVLTRWNKLIFPLKNGE